MELLLRRSTLWMLLNAAGMAWYLKLASALWASPGDEGNPGGPGDAFYWAGYLAPVLLGFLVLNGLALFHISRRAGPARKRSLHIWRTIAVLWMITLAFDGYKSARKVTAGHESTQQTANNAHRFPGSISGQPLVPTGFVATCQGSRPSTPSRY